jgi:hypothetical protein
MTTLAEAQEIVRQLTGISEINYEPTKAARLRDRRSHLPTRADLPAIDRDTAAVAGRRANYIAVRRIAELLGVTTRDSFAQFRGLLLDARPAQYQPPLCYVSPQQLMKPGTEQGFLAAALMSGHHSTSAYVLPGSPYTTAWLS